MVQQRVTSVSISILFALETAVCMAMLKAPHSQPPTGCKIDNDWNFCLRQNRNIQNIPKHQQMFLNTYLIIMDDCWNSMHENNLPHDRGQMMDGEREQKEETKSNMQQPGGRIQMLAEEGHKFREEIRVGKAM